LKIGSASGIDVPSAAVCITELGEATDLVKEIVTRVDNLRKGGMA